MWDQVKTLGNKELIYFGPLSDSNPDELGQKGIGPRQEISNNVLNGLLEEQFPILSVKYGNVENKESPTGVCDRYTNLG